MNTKEVTGAAQEVKGKVQKEVGKAVGDERTQTHGAAEEQKGRAKRTTGRVEGKVADVKKDVKDGVKAATR